MAYQVVGFTTSAVTGEKIMSIICDTVSDLPSGTIAGDYGGPIVQGCTAKVIEDSSSYVANSSGTWVKQTSQNAWVNVYTKSEMDDIVEGIEEDYTQDIQDAINSLTILTRADLYRGYQITANTDVDTLTDYGTYYCADGTTAATLSNCPITTSGFIMIIFSNGNRVRLFIAISATIPRIYIQARTGGTWRTIRQCAMTDEIQYDENMLGYAWGRYNVAESTGDVNASTTRIGTPDYFEIPIGTNTIVYTPMFDGVRGDVFYLFYDSSKTYTNQYIGWVSAGVPVKVPTNMKYYRLCFRKPNNDTIYVSDMIRCTRNYQ